ncbi:ammonia-forming cytochrome c nitrite reductase subunit c552 [Vibrio lentus]|nr:ammonia-forming cytochrome c nitrite reductase subunit c552 [Vibrio lentus]
MERNHAHIVSSRKAQVLNMKLTAEKQIVAAHFEAGGMGSGCDRARDGTYLTDIRHAQWRWDYAIASHGIHITHAPGNRSRSAKMPLTAPRMLVPRLFVYRAKKAHH